MYEFIMTILSLLFICYIVYACFILVNLTDGRYKYKREFKLDLLIPFRYFYKLIRNKITESYKKLK
jgi:hypothetical protein